MDVQKWRVRLVNVVLMQLNKLFESALMWGPEMNAAVDYSGGAVQQSQTEQDGIGRNFP